MTIRKILACILSAVCLIGVLPINAFAQSTDIIGSYEILDIPSFGDWYIGLDEEPINISITTTLTIEGETIPIEFTEFRGFNNLIAQYWMLVGTFDEDVIALMRSNGVGVAPGDYLLVGNEFEQIPIDIQDFGDFIVNSYDDNQTQIIYSFLETNFRKKGADVLLDVISGWENIISVFIDNIADYITTDNIIVTVAIIIMALAILIAIFALLKNFFRRW